MKAKTATAKNNRPPILVGYGFDLHNITTGKGLTLAGVFFNDLPALKAHSDGDVVLHAVANAVLGALGLGDIGAYFSDRDPAVKGIDSKKIVKFALDKMSDSHYHVGNADIQVVAQDLMIAPLRRELVDSLQELLSSAFVNIKGTRWEKSSKQVGCHVVLTLIKD